MKKNFLFTLIKVLTIVSCFTFLYFNIDKYLVVKIFKEINFSYILPTVLFFLIYLMLYTIFIFKIYDYLYPTKLNLISWIKIFINGNFLNSIPALGFIYKGYRLTNYKISIKDYLFANVFISWLAISIFFIVFSFEIIIFVTPKITIFDVPVFLILLILSSLAFTSPRICTFILSHLKIKIDVINSLFLFLQKKFSKKIVKHYLTYGLVLHVCIFLTYYFIIKLLNIPIGLKIIIVVFLINEIMDSIPMPNNNLLVTEILGGITATFVGVAFTEFVIIKFVFRIINLIIIIPSFIIVNILFKSEL
tara:strand:+ start:450 stop:1364 length:915 start_codon:yes stop_codon:yes gene_type:complete